jgi:dipeptidyl-peptidase-4
VVGKQGFPRRAANRDYNAASGNVAYTVGNNLYVNDQQVTDEPEGIVCGQSVHRNEFGITKGTFWSPKGDLLAFYRMDESMVTQYPLVDITTRVGTVNNVRYPMAGMTSHKVTVGIYNPATGTTVYLNAGDPTDRYFTNIAWAPDEQSIYLIELNRDQNHARLHPRLPLPHRHRKNRQHGRHRPPGILPPRRPQQARPASDGSAGAFETCY